MAAVHTPGIDVFQYEALSNPRNIRLLKLLPASTRSDELDCTLDEACLDDHVSYEALSYTWGDATQRFGIRCNGQGLSITSNLSTALRYLRPSSTPRTLWVDAVCINQNDIGERNQQVALMRDIYTKASQVVAWLGEEHPSDSAAMDFGDRKPLPVHSSEEDKVLKVMALQARLTSSLMSAGLLIQRGWFGRAWIIQEAALARQLQVQCGQKVIEWESLHANLRLLDGMNDASGGQVTLNNPFYQRLEFIEATRSRIKIARARHVDNRPLGTEEVVLGRSSAWKQIHSAIINARSYGATNQRDHIYALLGLVSNADDAPLSVDYSLPYTAIFRDFARSVIQKSGSLSALGQIDSSTTAHLESWVPDYSRVSMVDSLSSDEGAFYTASGDSEIRLLDPHDASVLALSGIFFDDVDEVVKGPSTDKGEVFSHPEQLMFKAMDKVNPTKVLPNLAYKAISHFSPQAKEAIDRLSEGVQRPKDAEDQASDHPVLSDRDQHYKQLLEQFTELDGNGEQRNRDDEAKRLFALATSTIKSLRPGVQSHWFGPMHSPSGVYMKPNFEERWQRLAQKCYPYRTEEDIEDVYWRTLIGNRRSGQAGNVDKPPVFWQDAYNIWHALLWETEGVIPRLLRGGGLGSQKKVSSLGGVSSVEDEGIKAVSADLRTYLREAYAEQQKTKLDQQLRASGMRAVVSTAISLSQEPEGGGGGGDSQVDSSILERTSSASHAVTAANAGPQTKVHYFNNRKLTITDVKKPPGFQPLSAETINQIADWVQRYPGLEVHEQERLRELLAPMADNNAAKEQPTETLRAKVDQAFRNDFLRIARNRKFCITKKRYMGWCPFDTKHGDRICLLFGGQTPYVVRKQGRGYRLLGEAYLHGVMDGEVLGKPDIKIEAIHLV
ncbi:MAG: hypothetical protein LQ346_005895 [Caloplaca aetnensis]|nr:MAG: hypothetical protein LQ346_005895 [Caloplaca aetnensis]